MLAYLANNGPKIPPIVQLALIGLGCRITRLGWFDDDRHRQITDEIGKFLQASVPHCIIGLQFLYHLTDEVNRPVTSRSLSANRKVSTSFRDTSLLTIFQISLATLKSLLPSGGPPSHDRMLEAGLKLAKLCLTYDFVGTCVDESSEDLGPLQVPSSWKRVLLEHDTLDLFSTLYANCRGERRTQAMECLVQFASVRRSLFESEAERSKFLSRLMNEVATILQGNTGLEDPNNVVEFCRFLAALKINYQLIELVQAPDYPAWLAMISSFTVRVFLAKQQYEEDGSIASSSLYYLLSLWSKFVASLPYLKATVQSHVEVHAPEIAKAYIASRLDFCAAVASGAVSDPLDDSEEVMNQLEQIPAICRCSFETIFSFILAQMDPRLVALNHAFSSGVGGAGGGAAGAGGLGGLLGGNSGGPGHTLGLEHLMGGGGGSGGGNGGNGGATSAGMNDKSLRILEGELTWLVYIIGSIIKGRAMSNQSEQHSVADGDLASRVISLIRILDKNTSRAGPGLERLDLAVLYFFQQFRLVYIGEQAMTSSKV